ncbi:hypothetical protein PFISCL1PPCAC_951 [Pristionchus fissidentatus]|uniref:Uncharacterized protein n=1 Tax=Pristionchus fissidentatus TaxID=1538716 RepID=A0AAV5UV97_9BILA|nr:hypothetical protein PFISCL1PPCAC_951 [Pristionchus fissidentatus]
MVKKEVKEEDIEEEEQEEREVKEEPVDEDEIKSSMFLSDAMKQVNKEEDKENKEDTVGEIEFDSFALPEFPTDQMTENEATKGKDEERNQGMEKSKTDEISEAIEIILNKQLQNKTKKNKLRKLLHSVLILNEMSVIDACRKYNVRLGVVKVYMTKIRSVLSHELSASVHDTQMKEKLNLREQDKETIYVTIDGITVPDLISHVISHLNKDRLDYSQARPFFGSKEELKDKMREILSVFQMRHDDDRLLNAVLTVTADNCYMTQLGGLHYLSRQTLTSGEDVISGVRNSDLE